MADDMSDQPPVYAPMDLRYWLAYGAIDWKPWDHSDIEEAAKRILLQLPGGAGEPLNILDLGLGIGILELPLLAQIQRLRRCPICIVGIDKSWKALEVTRQFLTDEDHGLANGLPTTTEAFLHCVQRYWPKVNRCSWPIDTESGLRFLSGRGVGSQYGEVTYLLIQTDLDFLDLTSRRGRLISRQLDADNPRSNPRSAWRSLPSNWPADMMALMTRASAQLPGCMFPEKFDALVASLSLMHMKWWRRTLWHGLRLLRKDGLFLHSKLGKDEMIFEGGGVPPNDADACTAEQVFGELFGEAPVQALMRREPRYYTATSPTELYDFLYHILGELGGHDDGMPQYDVTNRVQHKYYTALLRTAGYSILHSIRRRMCAVYEGVVKRVRDRYLHDGEKYDSRELTSAITWDAYTVKDPASLDQWCELFAESGGSGTTISRAVEYYQLHTAIHSSLSLDMAAAGTPGVDSRGYALARILEAGGLLHPDAVGGDLALRNPSGHTRFEAFINPLRLVRTRSGLACGDADEFLQGMRKYISLLEQRPYSNTTALVETFAPRLSQPCVLTFRRSDELSMDVIRCSGFYEIRISISDKYRPELTLPSSSPSARSVRARRCTEDVPAQFTFPLGDAEVGANTSPSDKACTEQSARALETLAQNLLDDLTGLFEKQGALTKHRRMLQGFLRCPDGFAFARSVCCLFMIPGWKTWVVFPGWYSGEDGALKAEESVLVAYSADLIGRDLAHEYEKFRVLFSKPGMSNAFRSGESDAFGKMRQVFGHELAKVYIGALRAMRVACRGSSNQCQFSTHATEAALRYGMLWAQCSDLSLVPKDARPVTNQHGNTWQHFAVAVAKLSWQTFLGAEVVRSDGGTIAKTAELVHRINALWSPPNLTNVVQAEGRYSFCESYSAPDGKTLDDRGFVNDFLAWFMISLTNAWKHVVLDPHSHEDKALAMEDRVAAVEAFLASGRHITVRAQLDGEMAVFSVRNEYVGPDSSPSRQGKTGLALQIASRELRRSLGGWTLGQDLFQGAASEHCWYATLCLPGAMLQHL